MFRLFKVCVFEFPMSVSLAHPNTGMHMCHCVMCKGEVRGSGYAGKRAPKHMLSGIFVSFLHQSDVLCNHGREEGRGVLGGSDTDSKGVGGGGGRRLGGEQVHYKYQYTEGVRPGSSRIKKQKMKVKEGKNTMRGYQRIGNNK